VHPPREAVAPTSPQTGQQQRRFARGELDAVTTEETDGSGQKTATLRMKQNTRTSLMRNQRRSWRNVAGAMAMATAFLAAKKRAMGLR
jgi:hypothetical protein